MHITNPVQNISGDELRGNASSEIFKTFTFMPTLNGTVVSMSLGITLFKERQPSLLRMGTLSKVESATVGLEDAAISFVRVHSLDIVEEDSVEITFIVIGLDQVEL